MRWEDREESENVEDRRGMPPVGGMIMGGGLGSLVIVLLAMILGMNPNKLMEQPGFQQGGPATEQLDPARQQAEAPIRKFVGVVFRDTEDVWTKIFREQLKRNYEKPKLVVFTDEVRSACGKATAAVGPFYCPGDSNVYLDFAFFDEMEKKFGAKGEFARAYVIGHEVGHHVQNLLGISDQVTRLQQRASDDEGRKLSVRLELQADYLAGVWVHHLQKTKHVLEEGDLDSAVNCAHQIGDDVLQKQATGRIRRESFTHGSAAQRKYWLTQGIMTGKIEPMMQLFEMDEKELESKEMP